MAPQYRKASASQNQALLEAFVATTGYVCKEVAPQPCRGGAADACASTLSPGWTGKSKTRCSWLLANTEKSSSDIFRELQRRSPGRYHPLQIRTLQRGMRKIQAHLLEMREEQ